VKRLLKALHTLGAMGVTGAVLCQIVLLLARPAPSDLERFAFYSQALADLSGTVLFPSLGLVVLSGFLSVGINRPFHSAPWVFIKLMFSVLVFESTLAVVHGPLTADATRAAAALAGDLNALNQLGDGNRVPGLLFILAVAVGNTALGIWRPHFRRLTHPKILRETPSSAN
jgi:hypothetical protein